MALGDALYSIIMSAGRSKVLTQADFTVTKNWGTTQANAMASVTDMIYFTRVEVITNAALVHDASGPLFLEAYLDNSDESSLLFSRQVQYAYAASTGATGAQQRGANVWSSIQPVRANTVYFTFRKVHPYPDTAGGTFFDVSAEGSEYRILVTQTPRNFT